MQVEYRINGIMVYFGIEYSYVYGYIHMNIYTNMANKAIDK